MLTAIVTTAMKNADDMLREIIDIVDVNGDGKIQFEGGGSKEIVSERGL